MMAEPQKSTMLSPEESLVLLRTFLGTRINRMCIIHLFSEEVRRLDGRPLNEWQFTHGIQPIEDFKSLIGISQFRKLKKMIFSANEIVQEQGWGPSKYYILTNVTLKTAKRILPHSVKIIPVSFDSIGNPLSVVCFFLPSPSTYESMEQATIIGGDGTILWHMQYSRETWQVTTTTILTPREIEVMSLSASGCSITDIADKLCVSTSTVNKTKQSFIKKLNCTNSMQAIRIAQAYNLLHIL